jgi:hypothetical protein
MLTSYRTRLMSRLDVAAEPVLADGAAFAR